MAQTIYLVPTEHADKTFSYKKDGHTHVGRLQICDLFLPGNRHPLDYELFFIDDSDRLEAGQKYTLGENSYKLDNRGNLVLDRYLTWVKVQSRKPAAS